MTGHTRLRLVPRGTLAAAALTILLGAGAAQAQQERGELMRDALSGIGLLEKRQAPIDYHERAPLVMPPKFDGKALPAPRARASDAAWPKEPEVVARERDAEDRRQSRGNQMQGRYNDNNATASIDEMRAGRRAGANMTTEAQDKPGDNAQRSSWLNPLELFKDKKDEEASDVAPTRDFLTQPPNVYRQAPKKVAKTTGEPIRDVNAEREEADPAAYVRAQARR